MNIDETNITIIHGVLINDLKTRLFKQHNEGKVRNPFTIVTDEDHQDDIAQMVSWVHKCASVNDINKLLTHYGDLFIDEDVNDEGRIFTSYTTSHDLITLDGTLNYVLGLLVERIENDKQIIHNLNLG